MSDVAKAFADLLEGDRLQMEQYRERIRELEERNAKLERVAEAAQDIWPATSSMWDSPRMAAVVEALAAAGYGEQQLSG